MRHPIVTIAASASLIATQLMAPALAQSTYPYPPPTTKPGYDAGYAGTLRCESRSNRTQRCNARTENRVDLIRVIGGRCSKGRDWGFTASQIWVSGGCRAEFGYGYGYGSGGGYPVPLPQPVDDFAGAIRCESRGNRYEQCNVPTNNRVELVRRLGGKCNAGRQWGYDANYIWVNDGCRAEFRYGYNNLVPLPGPKPEKDKGPSTGLIIGGIVVAGGLIALLASKNKKKKEGEAAATEEAATPTYPAGPPATLSANLSALPSASRPSVQNCMNDAARQIGVTGGTRLSYDKLVSLEQGNGGWRIRAAMTATYPDGARSLEMYCRATPSQIIQLDFS
ncbi:MULTISPECIES: DUF3011 domain-containing protein [unclassified Sphingopyxis]|uniref:DUF3011 domain-containing protein n=1 Tax=unclassified Sphingopyxis TaxID=2614943 RepID=UPI0007371AF0|nr:MULTISPECIES: DUF3011 domain-containing protein [unclassified Sphingopyxis]KTE38811.1 hypothetical protein ATE62_10510 [Sphingopyxis sp. HIX]KTE79696.1 hypothetical protein ATE72_18635 [Sphingopyxis sp. HXXIV]